jgi:hypothetical protein
MRWMPGKRIATLDLWRVERWTLSKPTSRTIDEIGLLICRAVDGVKGAPSVFDSGDKHAGVPAPVRSMTLETSQELEAVRSGSATAFRTADGCQAPGVRWVSDSSLTIPADLL